MTPAELAEIRARAEAATPGPWVRYSRDFRDARSHSVVGPGHAVRAFTGYGPRGGTAQTDAEFIAHARTDVPALLAEVERLTAENDRLRVMWDQSGKNDLIAENDRLRAFRDAVLADGVFETATWSNKEFKAGLQSARIKVHALAAEHGLSERQEDPEPPADAGAGAGSREEVLP
jgi:hypothetical protein